MKSYIVSIAIGSLLLGSTSFAEWVTKPYLGYGQMSLQMGSENLIDSQASSYTLGAQTGILIGSNLYIGADYSRSGPFTMPLKNSYYGDAFKNGLFTLYSGGYGIQYNFRGITLWVGTYAYHRLEEHRIDLRMKGNLTRVSLGFNIDSVFSVNLNYDKSTLTMIDETNSALSLMCYGVPQDSCSKTGATSHLYFSFMANIY